MHSSPYSGYELVRGMVVGVGVGVGRGVGVFLVGWGWSCRWS